MSYPGFLLEAYFAVLGLLIGSYLNVLVYRLPRRLSTVVPRSRCTRCRAAIRPWDNVPLLSFLWLGGRCRHCGAPISWRYPLVEAATAACFVAAWRTQTSLVATLVVAVFCSLMIVLAMIDLEHYLLPDALTYPGLAVGLIVLPLLGWAEARDLWLGAAFGAAALLAMAWGWYLWKRVHGMGMGDVKMLAMIGSFLGWRGAVATLFLASLGGSLVGFAMMLAGRMGLRSRLPFGVFLAMAGIATVFFRGELIAAYRNAAVFSGMLWRHGW